MTVTTLHKLIGLSVAMLGQAPGTDLLQQWTRLYTQSREDGLNAMAALQKVAQHILDSAAFEEVHPPYTIIENQDFAQRFLDSVLGETASAEVVTLVVGLLDGGTSRAEVAVRAVEYLLEVNHQGSDHVDYATFGSYAMRFGNQVEVAQYYTVDKKWMTPGESVLNEVDDTAASVTAAKGRIDGMQQPGKNFTLTTGVDQFTGTPGDDTFVATESTLNGADRLDGKEGMDTLELSSGSGANADISIPVGATVSHIETLSVSSDGKFSGDVSKWEGLKTVQLEVVKDVDLELKAGDGTKVTSTSLGDDDDASTVTIENAGMVSLESVSKQATVKITGEGTESVMVEGGMKVEANSAASPSLTLKSVTLDGVARNNGDDGKRDGTTGAGTAAKDKDKASVEVYSKALENIALHNTDAIVLFQNDDKDLTGLKAMVNKFGSSASMMGKLCLKGIEDLMLQVAGASYFDLASNEIKTVKVSGAGDLTLDVNKFDNSKASTTLESLMLSGSGKFTMNANGMTKLMTVDAEEASGAVSITNLGKSVMQYTGSAGKDTVTVAAFNSKGLTADLGDGDDTFTVKNISAGKSKIDGGAGMDTLVLMEQVGANLKGAGDAYMNFETITLDAGGGSGTYDLKGLDIDELKIGSSVGTAAGVKFNNVAKGIGLTVASSADKADSKSTYAIVDYKLESGEALRFDNLGTGLNLDLHAIGHKDDTKAIARDLTKRGTLLDLTVDATINTLFVDSRATPANNAVKPGDYVNRITLKGSDKIRQIKITGDARTHLSNVYDYSYDNGAAKGTGGNYLKVNSTALTVLEYVDARESGGIVIVASNNTVGMTVHGSPADDLLFAPYRGGNGQKDTLMGYGGNDIIAGGSNADKMTGGAGGDFLFGGAAQGYFEGANLGPRSVSYTTTFRDAATDTFIYTAASDSQVKFDSAGKAGSNFDIISQFEFGAGKDVIDLGKVVTLRGAIKNGNHGMNGASGGGDDFNNTKSLQDFVTTHHKGGVGVFETSASDQLGNNKHSIVTVDTREDGITKYKGNSVTDTTISIFGGGTIDNASVKWVLVDVDGDGDFDAGVDMAIALVESYGTAPHTDNFM